MKARGPARTGRAYFGSASAGGIAETLDSVNYFLFSASAKS